MLNHESALYIIVSTRALSLIYIVPVYPDMIVNAISMGRCLPFKPLTAKLFNWNFHPLEVVSR